MPSLLWIDDEVAPDDATVRLVALEGFRVDCAPSGVVGLAMVSTADYDGILLDLKLGDMPGLEVLRQLNAEASAIPVLVLTGHPEVESAVVAMQRGAWDFRSKTILFDDEWKAVFRQLVEVGRAQRASLNARNALDLEPPRPAKPSEIVRELIEELEASLQGPVEVGLDHLMGPLIQALTNRDLSTEFFLGCAKAFRQVATASAADSRTELVTRARDVLVDVERRAGQPTDPLLRMVIEMLETPTAGWRRRSEDHVAKTIDFSPSQVGLLLQRGTGWDFRTWRRAPAMRLAVAEIANTDEHIDQIAYRVGYEYPSQFGREFGRLLGVSPRRFRRLAKAFRGA